MTKTSKPVAGQPRPPKRSPSARNARRTLRPFGRSGIALLTFALTGMGAALGCQTDAPDAQQVIAELDEHIGRRVTIKARFRPGIRCRLDTEDGQWKTYCRDCQVCRGPYVVDLGKKSEDASDWPMVLAGTWKMRDIRCSGPLNDIECYPFEIGKTYVVEGLLERSSPPKLYVDDFRLVDDS